RDRVVIAEEEAVEPCLPRGLGDLQNVPRLLRGVEGAHGALDESSGRERREDLFESLVCLRPGGVEEPERRAKLHAGTAITSPSDIRERPARPGPPRPPRRRRACPSPSARRPPRKPPASSPRAGKDGGGRSSGARRRGRGRCARSAWRPSRSPEAAIPC